LNILTDILPKSLTIDGISYPIFTDFRVYIRLEEMIKNKNVSNSQSDFINEINEINPETSYEQALLYAKYSEALQMVYKTIPDNLDLAINQMLWFYQCGKTPEEKSVKSGKKSQQIYSYTYDADYIYAAFYEQYNVDLNKEKLHWWKFSAMFSGLKEDCMISKIMGYRATSTSGMDADHRKFYKKMKQVYKLPDLKSEEEKQLERNLEDALLNGGDLDSILNYSS
jgi:hypothetical protein